MYAQISPLQQLKKLVARGFSIADCFGYPSKALDAITEAYINPYNRQNKLT